MRFVCVLCLLPTLAYARPRVRKPTPQLAPPKQSHKDPRRVRPGDWKKGTMLFVDPEYGTFCRATLAGIVKPYDLYAVYLDWNDDIVVQVPTDTDVRQRLFVSESYPMDEVWIRPKEEGFELMGKRYGKSYSFAGGKPREVESGR